MKTTLSLLLLASCALAQAPRLVFETKSKDLGELIAGASGTTVFDFTNQGDADLVIRKVLSTCDCAAALLSSERIAPGESGQIEVVLSSRGRSGMVHSNVRIVSNDASQFDGGPNLTVLSVNAKIVSLVRVMPAAAYFPSIDHGVADQRRIVLTPERGDALNVTGVSCSSPFITVEAKATTTGNKQAAELTVRVSDEAPIGPLKEQIVVQTDVEGQEELLILVLGNVRGDILYGPSPLMLVDIQRGELTQQALTLQRDRGGPLEVLGAEIDLPFLAPVATELVDGKMWEVAVQVSEDAPPGAFSCEARVFVDDPQQPVITYHITGEIFPRVRLQPAAVWVPAEETAALASVRVFAPEGDWSYRIETPEGLEATIEARDRGCLLRFTRTGPLGEGAVILHSDVPGEGRVELPLVFSGQRTGSDVRSAE